MILLQIDLRKLDFLTQLHTARSRHKPNSASQSPRQNSSSTVVVHDYTTHSKFPTSGMKPSDIFPDFAILTRFGRFFFWIQCERHGWVSKVELRRSHDRREQFDRVEQLARLEQLTTHKNHDGWWWDNSVGWIHICRCLKRNWKEKTKTNSENKLIRLLL